MDICKSVIVSLSVVVAGCSVNAHKVACTGENWRQMGYDFAAEGESVRRFDQYRDQCGDGLEEGAMSAYLDGYTEGLVVHCTYEKGYDKGFHLKQPLDICPMEMRAQYKDGYKDGLAANGRRIDELEEAMRRYERHFDNEALRTRQSVRELATGENDGL